MKIRKRLKVSTKVSTKVKVPTNNNKKQIKSIN